MGHPLHPSGSVAATPRFPGPYHRHPDRRAEGPEWRVPFEQPFHKAPDAEPQHALAWGVNVDLQSLNAIPQPTGCPMPSRNDTSGVASRRGRTDSSIPTRRASE